MKSSNPRKPISLLARALSYLARREHSRVELGRKLARYATADDDLNALLDRLQSQGHLSDQRFAELTARRRGERYGVRRVAQELQARGVEPMLARAAVAPLRNSELQRARALWQRRYGEPARDPAERLRQMRFLAARGFSSEIVSEVVRGAPLDSDDA